MSRRQTRPVAGSIAKARTGIEGLDEITGGGLPRGRPTLVCGGRRLRQDAPRDGVPGARRDAIRRARRVHGLRGDRRGAGRERPLARLRPRRGSSGASGSLIDHVRVERSEIEETGEYDLEGLFVRLGHAIDTVGAKRVVLDTIESALQRLLERGDPARRAAPAVPLAQGPRRHRGDHRRARRGPAHPAGARGVRLRLRDPARPPRRRAALDAAAADRQVPRHGARHQRVPVPDRRGRHLASCRSPRCGSSTRCIDERISTGVAGARRDARRRLLPRHERPRLGHGRHRQDQPARPSSSASACRRGERCLFFAFEESARSSCAEHALDRDRPRAVGREGPAALPRGAPDDVRPRDAPRDHAQGGRASSSRRWSSSIRSPTCSRPGTRARPRLLADPADRLPEGEGHHRPLHEPHERERQRGADARSGSRRSSTPGCCCATSSPTASATAGCTCSSRAAWPTPTRSASSC